MAAGMARHGLVPVVNSFASFLASRANEQIYNQASERTKVVYAMHYAGSSPPARESRTRACATRRSIAAIPGVTVVHPCNAEETRAVVEWAVLEADESVAIRLAIGPSPRTDRAARPGIGVEPGRRRHAARGRGRDARLVRAGDAARGAHRRDAARASGRSRPPSSRCRGSTGSTRTGSRDTFDGVRERARRRGPRAGRRAGRHAPASGRDAPGAADVSTSRASRAGPPAARRSRRCATTGSTARRSRTAWRSRSEGHARA